MEAVMLILLVLPLAAGVACAAAPRPLARLAPAVTVASGVACFALVLTLVPAAAHGDLNYLSYLRIDAVSAIFLLATGFLYAAVAIYSVGYVKHHNPTYKRRFAAPAWGDALPPGDTPDPGGPEPPEGVAVARYTRRFYAGLNLFAWSMLAAPMMSSLALLWIAVEVTTIISALLVAIEDTDGAAEAAWKYVLIAS